MSPARQVSAKEGTAHMHESKHVAAMAIVIHCSNNASHNWQRLLFQVSVSVVIAGGELLIPGLVPQQRHTQITTGD